MNSQDAKRVLETALICASQPLPLRDMRVLFADELGPDTLRSLLDELTREWEGRGVELVAGAFGRVVILDAHEAPLQTGEAIISRRGQLRVDLRLQRRDKRESEHGAQEQPALSTCHGRASDSFSSRSCARS